MRIAQPNITESDGKKDRLFPYMARLRKLTYSCNLFVNIQVKKYKITDDGRYGKPHSNSIRLWRRQGCCAMPCSI